MSTSPIWFLLLAAVALRLAPTEATTPTATDTAPGGALDNQFKCGGCPCNQPCYSTPPPPPPPPPPSPKKPSPTPGLNCPPPPSYIYMNGPPGNLYPVDPYARSTAHHGVPVAPLLLLVVGLLGMVPFW